MKHAGHIATAVLLLISTFATALTPTAAADQKKVAEQKHHEPLVIFSASSLIDVLAEHADQWSRTTGLPKPVFAFGGSAGMARQIQAGAPAHIFISANPYWVSLLKQQGKTQQSPAYTVASNRLVLVATPGARHRTSFTPSAEGFLSLLGNQRLVLADPALAPAGQYAQAYLEKADLWPTLKNRIAFMPSVRQALRLAEIAGFPAFVYASDAQQSEKVTVLLQVPDDMIPPILYQAIAVNEAHTDAESFMRYLMTEKAATTWIKFGFRSLPFPSQTGPN